MRRVTHAHCSECGQNLSDYGQTSCDACLADLTLDGAVKYDTPSGHAHSRIYRIRLKLTFWWRRFKQVLFDTRSLYTDLRSFYILPLRG